MSEMTIDRHRQTGAGRIKQITIADALLVVTGVLAVIIRLADLSGLPLSPGEAAQAWSVWATAQPHTADLLLSGSPAYFTLTRLVMPVLGDGDAVMRLVPALFGVGTALLPWLWRARLGTVGALVASLLLTASPLHVITARTVGGESIAVFALLLAVIAYERWRETAVRSWLLTLAAALGLGLASAPLFYGGLATLAVAAGLQRLIGLPLFTNEAPTAARAEARTAVIAGVAVFVAAATLLLWVPTGLGAAARLPASWLAQFAAAGFISDPFLAAARYEPILLTLGLAAILWTTWRSHPLASFCVYWIAAVLLLIVLQRGEMQNALLLTLPGVILLGLFAEAHLQRLTPLTWGVAGGALLLFMLTLTNLARYLRLAALNPPVLSNVWMILFAFAFALVLLYFLSTWEIEAPYRGMLLALIVFFLYYGWGTAWWLGHQAANDPRERWVAQGTDAGVQVMLPLLRDVSRQLGNAEHDLDIFSSVDAPALRWYLRDFRRAQFSDALPIGGSNQVIITTADAEPVLGSDYMGAGFGLLRTAPPPENGQMRVVDTLRWWLFRESNTAVSTEQIILWLRADLVRTGE